MDIRTLRISLLMGLTAFACGCSDRPIPDQGASTALRTIAAPGSAESHLASGPDGTVVMSWLEPDGERVALKYAVLEEADWSAPRTIAASGRWFVNWADFPSVVPIDDQLWGAHWLAKQPGGTYAYNVAIAVSTDGGATWTDAITPHDDGTATEHGFVSLFPEAGGVGALWLDGRNMTGGHDSGHGGMTLRSAVIGADGAVHAARQVDGLVCDCCQTDVAIGTEGPIAVYRDRTDEEIRDIYVSRSVAGEWRPGTAVADDGWEIAACPVNGPSIAATGDDVVVAWFTAADDQARVRLARSVDGARTFGEPTDLDLDGALGRVAVVLLDDGDALISWLRDADTGAADIRVARVDEDGAIEDSWTIATTGAGRLSGFPQMVRAGDRVVFSWTDTAGGETVVRSALTTPP